MPNKEEPKVSNAEKEKKIYNLTIELAQAVNNKKAAVGGYNDEIKRIKAEITELIKDEI